MISFHASTSNLLLRALFESGPTFSLLLSFQDALPFQPCPIYRLYIRNKGILWEHSYNYLLLSVLLVISPNLFWGYIIKSSRLCYNRKRIQKGGLGESEQKHRGKGDERCKLRASPRFSLVQWNFQDDPRGSSHLCTDLAIICNQPLILQRPVLEPSDANASLNNSEWGS